MNGSSIIGAGAGQGASQKTNILNVLNTTAAVGYGENLRMVPFLSQGTRNSNTLFGATKHVKYEGDKTRLMSAARSQNYAGFKQTLKFYKPNEINTKNDEGKTALMHASKAGNIDTIRLLVEKGADINLPDKNGFTALYYAVEGGNAEAVRFLLENGANPNDRTARRILRSEISPLLTAVRWRRPDIVKILIEYNADIHSYWVMHEIFSNNLSEILRILLKAGVDPNKIIYGIFGSDTLLIHAAKNAQIELVKVLLEEGANPALVDKDGKTAYALAKENVNSYWIGDKYKQVVSLFEQHGITQGGGRKARKTRRNKKSKKQTRRRI